MENSDKDRTSDPTKPHSGAGRSLLNDGESPEDATGEDSPGNGPLLMDDDGLGLEEEGLGLLDEDFSKVPPEDVNHLMFLKIDDQLQNIAEQLSGLRQEMRAGRQDQAQKDQLIDSLHRELQEYKQGILKRYMQTALMDIIQLIDDFRKLGAYYRNQSPEERDPEKLLNLLENVPSDMEDLLYRQGIVSYRGEPEQDFDPGHQTVLKKIPTPDPELERKVAESLRPGYEWEGEVIRPEMVAVYVLEKQGS